MTRTLLIAHADQAHLGGGERVLLQVAREARSFAQLHLALMWQAENIAHLTDSELFDSALELDAPRRLNPMTAARYFAALRRLRALLGAHGHCLSFSWPSAVRCAAAAAGTGVQLAWMCQDELPRDTSAVREAKLRAGISALRAAQTRVVCPSAAIKTQLVERGYDASLISVIANGIDVEHFASGCVSTEERAALRRKARIDENAFVLCCVARLDPGKDHLTLLRAVARLGPKYDGIVVLCVGGNHPNARTARVQGIGDELGLRDRVRWVGEQADVRPWLALSDAAVLPSRYEACGLSLLEAAAMQLPLIGSNVGGIPEIVRTGQTGIVFEPGDVGGCARSITQLYDMGPGRAELGRAARQLCETEFSEQRMRARWRDFVAGFLSEP